VIALLEAGAFVDTATEVRGIPPVGSVLDITTQLCSLALDLEAPGTACRCSGREVTEQHGCPVGATAALAHR
jgi:hypothetical protein